MTPRRLRTTGLLILVGAGLVVSPHGIERSYAIEQSYDVQRAAPDVTASPSTGPSRAGSRAGEGRERPGRREALLPDGEVTAVPEAVAPSASPPRPVRQAAAHTDRTAAPRLQILPLGSGLVLVGLGLGLALLALRVRRG